MKKTIIMMLCTSLLLIAMFGCSKNSTTSSQAASENSDKTISKNRSHGDVLITSLDSITKNGITVIYSNEYKENAIKDHERLLSMQKFYMDRYNTNVKLELCILDKSDWENGDGNSDGAPPYGIPHVDHNKDDYTIYIPATEDGFLVKDAMRYKDMLTDDILKDFADAGYTYDDGVKLFPNLIGLHEVGHTFVDSLGMKNIDPWFNEFLATYFAYSYLVESDESLAKLWVANGSVAFLDGSKPKYNSLEDFDRLIIDVGPSEYDWYQKQFAIQAKKVYDIKGITFIDEVIELYKRSDYDQSKLISQLELIIPVFKNWTEDMKNFNK